MMIFIRFSFLAQLNFKGQYVFKNIVPNGENYKVEQIHFHWGHSYDNNNGSEHVYEGKPYPLEVSSIDLFLNLLSFSFSSKMHIVSYSNWYSNIRDAMTNTRSLAVIGVFFEVKFPFDLLTKCLFS